MIEKISIPTNRWSWNNRDLQAIVGAEEINNKTEEEKATEAEEIEHIRKNLRKLGISM